VRLAYEATAEKARERERMAQVLAFSQVLAANPRREEAVATFCEVAADAFDAAAVVVCADDAEPVVLRDQRGGDVLSPSEQVSLRGLVTVPTRGALEIQGEVVRAWQTALAAPLDADGSRMGVVVLGRGNRTHFTPRERTLLTSMADSLAAALGNAEHQARAAEEATKLKAVVDQSSDGIFLLDHEGNVRLWNPAMSRISGRSAGEVLGQPLAHALQSGSDPSDNGFVDAWRSTSADRPLHSVELQLRRRDGEERIVRCSYATTVREDASVRCVVNVHDVTRERQVERLKSDFIATVSHELRSPVTPIKGYAELLLNHGEGLTVEKRAQYLGVIADRANHLGRLVEDLLLASRISSEGGPVQGVTTAATDLKSLVDRSMADFNDRADRITLRVQEGPMTVLCDPVRTAQVVSNLVSNALKYSPDGSPVQVSFEQNAETAVVVVTDSGHGIPEDQLDLIFEKFHRVEDPMVMTTSGTGLGLYIARHLARAMGGDITVTSTFGVGSAFCFSLPRCKDQLPSEGSSDASAGSSLIRKLQEEAFARRRPGPRTAASA
jgi:PAS domain S-box-containing protein